MFNISPSPQVENDIFNQNEFEIYGLYFLEHNQEKNFFFRWSNYYFSIQPKLENIENIGLSLFNIFESRKIFICTCGQRKEIDLKYGENHISIPIIPFEKVYVFLEPTGSLPQDKRLNLGVCVKKIFINKNAANYIDRLISSKNHSQKCNYKNYDIDVKKYLGSSFARSKYPLKFLDLKPRKNSFYYNPCLFNYKDEIFLSCRFEYGQNNDVDIFRYPSLEKVNFTIKKEIKNEQIQDARFLKYKNAYIMTCANYVDDLKDYFHKKWIIFDEDLNQVKNVHPVYGKNGFSIKTNKGDEKNWVMFERGGKLYFVYKMFPHTVVETNINGEIITEHITHSYKDSCWKFGKARCTSNPIYKDGSFHSFFHSHIEVPTTSNISQRLYFAGYYKFEPDPPFRILEVKTEPILAGNNSRVVKKNQSYLPFCVFPMGAVLQDNKFLVSFGINDEECAVMEFDPNK